MPLRRQRFERESGQQRGSERQYLLVEGEGGRVEARDVLPDAEPPARRVRVALPKQSQLFFFAILVLMLFLCNAMGVDCQLGPQQPVHAQGQPAFITSAPMTPVMS